jgi:3-hydroxy-5-methyl-1-naphthoate 3-O-methyltransferase
MNNIELPDIQKQVATLQIAERFFESVVLFALVEVGVFEHLSSGDKSLAELQERIRGDEESLRATLDAAVAIRVLHRKNDRYGAPEYLLDCLGRKESAPYLGEWISFLHASAAPLFGLDETIRTGVKTGSLFESMGGDTRLARRMTQATDAYARTRGVELADHLDFSDGGTLLDLGCGPGTYSLAILDRNPKVRATLLDLSAIIAETRQIVTARGCADRVEFVAADAGAYTPAHPYDTVLMSNMLHTMSPAESVALLKRVYGMTSPGGRVIIQAQYLDDTRTYPRWPALVNLILRVASPSGRNHAIGETGEWLREAGFIEVYHQALSVWNVNSCVIGIKPRL